MGWQIPLIRQMIRKGYPIDGLTIGAGVPSAEVAKEYIETIGLKHISFKPGSYNTILAVIEIAKSHPYFPIGLQWTGGRGGGHHSFEDFHEPILKAYGKIRECANIVLIAGSGFGSANDTYLYITGDWSRARGYPSMPFDGVLLGSRMMVAKEAFTSPQAKELIIQATGVPDSRWHETYQRPAGGVITIQSEMGQPIHMLATRGVMLWHELDRTIFCIRDQAKRVGELQSRKAEIIDRLNKDYQRPWFAVNSRAESVDIEDLTYVELLQRLISLVYVQHQQRWIDVSYKKLILDFAVRARDRLRSSPQAISNLKDPYHFLSEFTLACPSAADELVHVEDASFFIGLCKRSGQKPVNFIPRLDENFEHWFKKDSLWQAEDVDAVIDADAQRTCIIQGPVAAYHSRVVDESAQSILDGIAKPHVEMVRRDFYFDKSIPSVNTNANAAVPLAKYVVLAKQLQGVSVQQTASRIQYEFSSFGELVNDTTFAAHLEQLLSGWAKACVVDATISQGKTRRKNFISALFAPRYDHVVSIDYKDDKTVASLSVSTKDPLSRIRNVIVRLNSFDGRRILMTFSSPSRFKKENVILRFEYDYLPDKPWCRIYEDMRWRNKRIKSFYAQLWLGDYSSSLRYATLQDEFQGNTTTITQSMIQEFSRVVSSSEGTQNMTAFADGVVPLDFSIVLSWEALVKPLLILDIDGDLLQLLHVSNKFDYCSSASPLCIEDTVETTSRIMAVTIQPSGKLVEVVATISRHGEAVLEVNSVFLFQGSFSDYEGTFRRSKESSFEVDVDSERKRALLLSRSWLLMDDLNCDLLGKNLLFRLEIETTYRQYNVMKGLRVTGQVYVCESNATSTSIGQIEFEAESCHGNPVLDFLNRYSSQPDKTTPLQNPGWEGPSSWKIRTPRLNSPYARVSKDTNPIHVSHVFVSYAQLPGTVTHGMFTSAAVRRLVENAAAEADYTRFKRWATTFEGMVLPGDELKVEMQHLAMAEGRLVLKVQAYNHITGNRVLDAEAVVEQAPTAYVFTGQGSQKKGMGMSLYDSSPAARSVWDRSDKHLRDLYGRLLVTSNSEYGQD